MAVFFSSFRARLVLLIVIAATPLCALLLYNGLEQRRQAKDHARAMAMQAARSAASHHQQLLLETRAFLTILAQLPAMRDGDASAVSALLRRLAAKFPQFANMGVVEPNGKVLADASTTGSSRNVSEWDWFQRIVKTHQFTLGDYAFGSFSRRAILICAYPIEKSGRLRRIVVGALDLSWLGQIAAEAQLPQGSTITVVDHNGTMLARNMEPEKFVGKKVPQEVPVRSDGAESGELVEGIASDGVMRLFTAVPLLGDGSKTGVRATVGIPTAAIYAEANRALARNLASLILVTLMILAAVWLGTDRLLLRPVHKLVGAASSLAQGDLKARSGLKHGPHEFGILAQSFDTMTSALQRHDAERRRADADLRASEQRYRLLFERNAAGVFRSSLDGRIIECNDVFAHIFGYASPREVLTKTGWDFYQRRADREAALAMLRAQGSVRNLEVFGKHKDGSPVWVLANASLSDDRDDQVLFGTVIDVTERKQAEHALHQSEERYRTLVKNAPVCIHEIDLDGRLTSMNPAGLRMLGGDSESRILGLPYLDLISPEDRERVEALLKAGYGGARSEFEFSTVGKSGRRYFTSSIVPVRGADSSVLRLMGITAETTDRKRAEKALRQSEEQYRSFFHSNSFPMWVCDLERLSILDVNEALVRLLGYSRAELLSMTAKDIRPYEDIPILMQSLADSKPGFKYIGERRLRRKDGTLLWVESARHALSFAGRPAALVSVSDISARKQAEGDVRNLLEQMQRLLSHLQSVREEERTQVAREIHDELSQTLTALKLDLAWLQQRLEHSTTIERQGSGRPGTRAGEQQQPLIESCIFASSCTVSLTRAGEQQQPLIERARAMLTLIDGALDAVEKISIRLRPALLDNLGLRDAIEWQARTFQERTGVACRLRLMLNEIERNSTRDTAIFRVFQEALTNVARHAGATTVRVSLTKRNGEIVLTVADNGRGITPSEIDDHKSFGILGMRERALFLGGKIVIHGVPGKGTTLTLEVPLGQG